MPREQITFNPILESHTGPTVDGIPSATVNVEHQRRNVHVAWNRRGGSGALGVSRETGWVQLGIDVSIADLRSMLASAEAEAHTEARKLADFGEFDIEAWQYRVVSDVIDRAETNLTIATLRRARDTAYGRDA